MQVLRDPHYGAALGAAPLFWLLLLLLLPGIAGPAWALQNPMRFLLIALAFPLLEEMTFRGLLQPALYRRRWGPVHHLGLSAANWLTSLAFAASHLVWHDALQALAVFVPGLVFGHFRDRYARITPSVLLHMFYNTGFALLFAGAAR
jgi:membrane protease YdiL (CAAX protease family)